MTKKTKSEKIQKHPGVEMWLLSEALTELILARDYIKNCNEHDAPVEVDFLELLVMTSIEKAEYFEKKEFVKEIN